MFHSIDIDRNQRTLKNLSIFKITQLCRANKISFGYKIIFIIFLLFFNAAHASAQSIIQASTSTPRAKTVEEIIPLVNQYCGSCHRVPQPNVLSKKSWPMVIESMASLAEKRMGREYISKENIRDITAYYYGSSAEKLPLLPYIDKVSDTVEFSNYSIVMQSQLPLISNIISVNFGKGTEFLVCDGSSKQLIRLSPSPNGWQQTSLAEFEIPIHTQVVDYDGDGLLDIIVVDLGVFPPPGDLPGKIFLLRQLKTGLFEKQLLLDKLGRATDARARDLDNDGDFDLAVAIFGGDVGEIFWMENLSNGKHKKHLLLNLSGALNISPADINGDGKIDMISLISQEHEMIVAFINEGKGVFKTKVLARAPHPMFGSTSMEPVDIDGDDDIDILFTNGDAFDYQSDPKPYHGVQWLENKGNLDFEFHDIGRFYGAATAVAADLDLDGDLDIVVSSWLNHWEDEKRQTLIWFENDGKQNFTPLPISNKPASVVTISLHDLNGDRRLDIVAGSFRMADLAKKLAVEAGNEQPSTATDEVKTLLPSVITLDNRSLKSSSD